MTDKNNGCKFIFTSARMKLERLIALIESTPMTRLEIETKLHISRRHAMTILSVLHESNRIYIAKWSHESIDGKKAHLRPMWRSGKKKDVPRPAALTNQQINQRSYARLRQDPEKYAIYLRDQNQRHKDKNFVPRMDVAASWIVRPSA